MFLVVVCNSLSFTFRLVDLPFCRMSIFFIYMIIKPESAIKPFCILNCTIVYYIC